MEKNVRHVRHCRDRDKDKFFFEDRTTLTHAYTYTYKLFFIMSDAIVLFN